MPRPVFASCLIISCILHAWLLAYRFSSPVAMAAANPAPQTMRIQIKQSTQSGLLESTPANKTAPVATAEKSAPDTIANSEPQAQQSPEVTDTTLLYFDALQFTQAPYVVGDWELDITQWPQGMSKQFSLRVYLSAHGSIDSWELLSESDPYVEQALATVRRTLFNPAYKEQLAVPSVVNYEITLTKE